MSFSFGGNINALILGHTGGIGEALYAALSNHKDINKLIGLSRASTPDIDYQSPDSLQAAAQQIQTEVGELNCLLIATGILTAPNGAPPEKSLSEFSESSLSEVLKINTIGPALALKAFLPLMPRKGICRVGVLSARVGSIGDNKLGGWISYRASKAALNQIVHTAAIELQRKNSESVCLALHPGTIETRLSKPYARDKFTHSAEECAHNLLDVLCSASPEQTGGFYDYAGKEIVW